MEDDLNCLPYLPLKVVHPCMNSGQFMHNVSLSKVCGINHGQLSATINLADTSQHTTKQHLALKVQSINSLKALLLYSQKETVQIDLYLE